MCTHEIMVTDRVQYRHSCLCSQCNTNPFWTANENST